MRKSIAIFSGSAILACTTLVSYAAGFFRDRTFAQTFGASHELDAYNAAFLMPDFLFNVFVASGIAAAVVPLLTDLLSKDREGANRYINTILTTAVSSMALMAVVLMIFARPASALVAPGFSAADRQIVVELLRILTLSPLLFAASNALGAALVTQRRFLFYGLSPIFYNIGIIGGALFLAPTFGIIGVAWGTVAGAALHLLLRVWGIRPLGFRFQPTFAVRMPEFRQTLKLMAPKMVGHPVELATFWAFTAIASNLAPGSIAVLNFARNFQSVPVSIIGIAAATAAFPLLTQAATEHSIAKFRRIVKMTFWLILATSGAAALMTFFFREPLISILFGGKAFGAASVTKTAAILGVFALAIPTEALAQLLARAFYAIKNTTIPVVFSVISFCIAAGGAWLLVPTWDLLAIPAAFATASAVKLILLMIALPWQVKRFETSQTIPQLSSAQDSE